MHSWLHGIPQAKLASWGRLEFELLVCPPRSRAHAGPSGPDSLRLGNYRINLLVSLASLDNTNTGVSADKNDESLNRWKASLGLNTGEPTGDPNDPRKCIIKSLALEVEGRPDVVIDVSAPGAVDSLKDKPFTIKEGATFRIKVVFTVHHEVLSGLKYLQVVKRKGVRVSKDEEMLVRLPIWCGGGHPSLTQDCREALPPARRASRHTRRSVSCLASFSLSFQ